MTKKINRQNNKAFNFFQCTNIVQVTGLIASDLKEFLDIIKIVDPGSIFYHLHQVFLKYHFAVPEYPNDFALWSAEFLQYKALAEKLANIDIHSFHDMESLRNEIVNILEEHVKKTSIYKVPQGQEFYFSKSITAIIPTSYKARNLEEFKKAIQNINNSSLYFHIFEAKLRLPRRDNDFSNWLETSMERLDLAVKIRKLDPYLCSLEDLRKEILKILNKG